MMWPDMDWIYILGYDLWNFAYTYNCISDHSVYCGVILLLSCTIPAFFIKKGCWLQHRAHTGTLDYVYHDSSTVCRQTGACSDNT